MERDKLIWELQLLAQQEYTLKNDANLKTLAEELRRLRAGVQAGEKELENLFDSVASDETKALELEKQAETIAKQVKSGKEKLYSTKGSSLKELLSIQQSVQKMDDEIAKSEALYIETLNGIEEQKAKSRQTRDLIRSIKKEYNDKLKVYREKKRRLGLEQAALTIKQEEIKERLEPTALRIYEDTQRRFPRNPVAVMKNGVCTGCNIEIPMVLTRYINEGKNLYRCDSCGRVLIRGIFD